MALKRKSVKREVRADHATAQKDKPISLATFAIRQKVSKVLTLSAVSSFLSIVFHIIWILIGFFVIWFLIANLRLGAFDQLMGTQKSAQTAPQDTTQTQAPAEADVPGIGRLNVACVQKNLDSTAISKIVQDKSDKSLTDAEKKKLAECVVSQESTPAASASPKQ